MPLEIQKILQGSTRAAVEGDLIPREPGINIDVDFKERTESRLNILRDCMDTFTIPDKAFTYDWECNLCNCNKTGLCVLCDQEGFDLKKVCGDLNTGDVENRFDKVINAQLEKFGVKAGQEGK